MPHDELKGVKTTTTTTTTTSSQAQRGASWSQPLVPSLNTWLPGESSFHPCCAFFFFFF